MWIWHSNNFTLSPHHPPRQELTTRSGVTTGDNYNRLLSQTFWKIYIFVKNPKKLKIRNLEIRLFIDKMSNKIKPRHLGCSGFVQKDCNGHTQKVNKFQYWNLRLGVRSRGGKSGNSCQPSWQKIFLNSKFGRKYF